MSGKEFSFAATATDGKYNDNAARYEHTGKSSRCRWGIIAASICLLIAGALTAWLLINTEPPAVISQYGSSTNTSHCYAAPKPGEYYCFIEVDAARSEYAGKNVAFLLAFDVFTASENTLTEDEKAAEYQRLIELGYQIYQTTYIAYMENGKFIEQPIVVGIFTEEQLANFNVNNEYGYAFHFVSNIDSSEFSVSEDELITSYQTNFAG